jgi:NADH dehydrogenase
MILVTGATGFVGRRVVERLIAGGQSVRALMRNESRSSLLPSGVDVAKGDVLDIDSLNQAITGVDSIVHLAAVIREIGSLTFQRVNYEGTKNILEAANAAGVQRIVCASTVGATSDPAVPYLYSRWMAEEEVSRSGLAQTIIRFSIGFGEGDEFFNQLAALVKLFPLVPVVGDGKAVFQPIAVEDVARCMVESMKRDDLVGKTIDIGGPQYFTYDEMMDLIAETLDVKIAKAHVPVAFMAPAATVLEALVPHPPVTREQLKMLKLNNTADLDSVEKHFDFAPRPVRGNIDYIRQIGLGDALKMNLGFMPEHIRDR